MVLGCDRRTRPTAARSSPRRRWPGSGARSPATTARTTSSGRATSTRWRPPRSRPVIARAAGRALDYLWTRQQEPDGCFPQNSNVDGTPTGPACSSTRSPTRSCSRGSSGAPTPTPGATWSAPPSCILANGPVTQERWENATGYSPASIGAEIAGPRSARRRSPRATATAPRQRSYRDDRRRLALAARSLDRDHQRAPLARPRTSCDSPSTATRTPARPTRSPTAARRSTSATVVDPSFLELVRLGVLRADDPAILSTLPVVDRELGVDTPNGDVLASLQPRRLRRDARPAARSGPTTRGRLWPIFAGERGEYELAAGAGELAAAAAATSACDAMATTANDGLMLPEQVWDDNPPAGRRGPSPGPARARRRRSAGRTRSSSGSPGRSTPGARWSSPRIVACRYG